MKIFQLKKQFMKQNVLNLLNIIFLSKIFMFFEIRFKILNSSSKVVNFKKPFISLFFP